LGQEGKSLEKTDKQFCSRTSPKEALNGASHSEPKRKLPLPLVLVGLFHLLPRDNSFQKLVNEWSSELAAVQGHTHSIATKGRYHTCCITQHEYAVLYLCLWGKVNLGDSYWEVFVTGTIQ
jgi:hypothetical protein